MLWLRLHFRRRESSAAAQSPALIPIASECPEQLLRRSSGSSPPAHEAFQGRRSVPAKKAFGQQTDQNPSPPAPSFPSLPHAAAQGLPGNATEVAHPGPAGEPFHPACKL